ncbi:MAG: xanthine dehydrogenase molybdopterin binding subunit [Candidatus Nanopelagicales bacterium]
MSGRVVGRALPDESAGLHVTGRATYVDDIPEPEGTAHGVLVLSTVAHGRITSLDAVAAQSVPGVLAVVTTRDIPGVNSHAPRVGVDPLLADDEVTYLGQPVAMVVASDRRVAERAAALVEVEYDALPFVLDPLEAHAAQDYVVPPMHLVSTTVEAVGAALASAPHRAGESLRLGGQEHFYLETMAALATPLDDGSVVIRSSTQHPTEVQHVAAKVLALPYHRVRVECRRMGGAFGGKESQAAQVASLAALGAMLLGRAVKVRLDRRTDDRVTGKRHPFDATWDVGFDDDGRILGYRATLVSNAGHTADLSGPVLSRALAHLDNAYWLPHADFHGYAARTNVQSSTAFRGFGGPQGALVTEVMLDSVARHLGVDPLDVRLANLYRPRPTADDPGAGLRTPYDTVVDDNVLPELVDQLVSTSDYRRRRAEVAAYNASSPVLKRGLALTPLKFGIAFTLTHLNQAGAIVHVYTDGSVLVNHSATEMGQGVNTKVAQVVAEVFGLPLERVRSTATDTEKVPNTSATAASTGSDMNGMAAQTAALEVRGRLAEVAARALGCAADDVEFVDGEVRGGEGSLSFADVVGAAYTQRVQLWADGFYRTPGLHWDRERMKGRPHQYFCYGAAVSEVVVDTLTGEHRVLRVDVLHDVGRSLNPTIDRGQIEGALVQGIGWLTTEELRWDEGTGALETLAPTTYKIPAVHDLPADLRVTLFDGANPADTIHRSKAVGEPPLLLAFSAFLAIRDAVSAVGEHRTDPPLRAPATAEAILDAIDAVRPA